MPQFTWSIDPAITRIGSFELRYYSLIFVAVFLGGYALLNWQIRRGGGDEEEAGDFILYGVLGVLLGARLGHVLFYDLDKALENPLWVFQIWTGGLASHGAVIGLIVAMYLFTKRRGIPFVEGADRFAFSAALGATLVRIGNFFNSEIVGRPTDQSWGVAFPRHDHGTELVYRHPSQLYEAALGLLVLGALFLWDRYLGKEKRPRGAMIAMFFALYFPGRFVVEFFKAYQTLESEASPLTMGQYLSVPGALLGLFGLYWAFSHKIPAGWPSEEPLDDEDEEYEDEEGDEEDDEYEEEDEDEDEDEAGDEKDPVSRDPDVESEFDEQDRERKKRQAAREAAESETGKTDDSKDK